MSWDLYVANIPEEFKTTDDVPKGWEPPDLGTGTELIAKIKAVFPEARLDEMGDLEIIGKDYAIDLGLAPGDVPLPGFLILVRGGESVVYAIAELLNALGCRAFDTAAEDGQIFPGPDITAGWRAWSDFRNQRLES